MSNYGCALPAESRYFQVYKKNSPSSIHGDGLRYHVFSYEKQDYIMQMFDWENEKNKGSLKGSADKWLDSLVSF